MECRVLASFKKSNCNHIRKLEDGNYSVTIKENGKISSVDTWANRNKTTGEITPISEAKLLKGLRQNSGVTPSKQQLKALDLDLDAFIKNAEKKAKAQP